MEPIKHIISSLDLYARKSFSISSMFSSTSYDSSADSDQLLFAGYYHIDSYLNQLKILIPFTDIDADSGPTQVLTKSHGFRPGLLFNYLSWIYHKKILRNRKQFLPNKYLDGAVSSHSNHSLVMSRGDVCLLNTRSVHRASTIRSGERQILWIYCD